MALVVFLRGVNVGGHRRFRPSALAAELKHLGAVNIGAAGTFVDPRSHHARETARRIGPPAPVRNRDRNLRRTGASAKLIASEPYASERAKPDVVRFISVLTGLPRSNPDLPMAFPGRGTWLVRILARDGCFIVGQYRRHMKTIGHLGGIDRVFGVPVTTRNWGTIASIRPCAHLQGQPADSRTTTQSRTRPDWLRASVARP